MCGWSQASAWNRACSSRIVSARAAFSLTVSRSPVAELKSPPMESVTRFQIASLSLGGTTAKPALRSSAVIRESNLPRFGATLPRSLYPVTAPSDLGSVDPNRGKFDSLITAELRSAGFAVVPPNESEAIWKRVTDSIGGLFNSATGERDTVKLNAARALTMRELHARFQADAWLHPHIVSASAKFYRGNAQWDGAKQTYQSFGKKMLTAMFGHET